ncbi:carcinoembryonic antigen-related cell adhesion molecule 1-like isoform X2 [Syngnathus typhle]|uniref:carcinoembryonic antigen-related cell adhesion molecule 1-like isoform X2 n=1 Tax=Syngnathus typhle TaxID=161592 RepID=UPI002A699A27|nr:carcinoembryonic antigen-related cell adhesion molecule 1-like isoform X2 [Syngnathus typhle]
MERGQVAVLLLLLLSIQGLSAVRVLPSSNPAAAGDTLTLSLWPAADLKGGSWAIGDSLILTWLGDQQAVFPNHSGRVAVNVRTAALTLSSLTLEDSGVYAVHSSDPPLRANASITVLEPVLNVTLGTKQSRPLESSPVALTCSVSSGSSPSFLWFNGSSEVTAHHRVAFSDGNSTLTILNVSRYDGGPFRCFAFNPVSNGTSKPFVFTVIYGPDNVTLTVNDQHAAAASFVSGSNLTVRCSAQSGPPALLHWAFEGHFLNTTGPSLELVHVNQEQSGPYSCLAFNNETNRSNNITEYILITKSQATLLKLHVWLFPVMPWFGCLLSNV